MDGAEMLTINADTDLAALAGTDLGESDWITIDQARVNAFADATDDRQWIHVDPKRAADGPFGATIAHGFLILSLLPALSASIVRVEEFSTVVNYGLDRVRFPAPVRVGRAIRDRLVVDAVEVVRSGTLLTVTHTVEIQDSERPACVARQLRLLQR
jgi:acyl dehydratase